ncbi:homoserine O-acetyltransferase MetX [Pontibacter cellulosilyticus]|uniref:Homoserine O-acetyltransferase n=1 Tax=Pontibacter cellulosilyticus TaxID=1720253 RepID=A0A923NB34_9BACT|nr:homoserine O-acetyltransferase [Pontibacter cellulosilyticus]MBC5994651.1 homoserine O-acetyltransferase [Pontibacter cellulosilyticus]
MKSTDTSYFTYNEPFRLESGEVLPALTIAYHTYGTLNAAKDNVVWICHALTANADAADWWNGLVGEGLALDPEKYFIVCANILGSCYGTTGPLSINPVTQEPYFSQFPAVTIRDMVNAHILLRQHLQLEKIHLMVGGSIGGYQALEWCVMESEIIENLFLLATSAAESAWGISIHTSQRLAIEADSSWQDKSATAGSAGLKAARAIGMLTYRNYEIMVERQSDPDTEKTDNYRAESYIRYQGDKLVNRFNAYTYWLLTKAMDSHNLSRGRGRSIEQVLRQIKQRTLIIGISSDILCPVQEQVFISRHMPNATYVEIGSSYGHDGFLIESERISAHLVPWLEME